MEFPDVKAVFDYKNVQSYLAKQLPKASWSAVVTNLVLYLIIIGIATSIVFLLSPSSSALSGSGTSVLGIIALVLVVLVGGFISFFIVSGILHLIAKAFGGKGTLVQLLYLLSVVSLAFAPISFVLVLLSVIPYVSCIASICGVVLGIYSLYLSYLILQVAHKLDSNKALLTLGAYIAVMIIIAIIIAVIFVGLLSVLYSSAMGSSPPVGMSPYG